MTETEQLLSTAEAVRYTRIPRLTLLRAVRSGDLPALHPNQKVYLFAKEDLDEWVDSIREGV